MAMDFGKQVGPLPLGAWVVVVGAGLGIAYYTTRGSKTPTIVESGNGTPGVGVGGSGMFTELVPVTQPSTPAKPTTNEQWGVNAINWAIAMGYPSNMADSAVRKYLTGAKLDAHEFSLIGLVLVSQGSPPQVLPPAEGGDVDPPPTTPPPTTDSVPTHAGVKKGWLLDEWIRDINGIYPTLGLSWERYYAFNPLYPTYAVHIGGVGHRAFSYDGYVRIR